MGLYQNLQNNILLYYKIKISTVFLAFGYLADFAALYRSYFHLKKTSKTGIKIF